MFVKLTRTSSTRLWKSTRPNPTEIDGQCRRRRRCVPFIIISFVRFIFFRPGPFPVHFPSKTLFIIEDVTRADSELNFSLLSLVKLLESFTFFF